MYHQIICYSLLAATIFLTPDVQAECPWGAGNPPGSTYYNTGSMRTFRLGPLATPNTVMFVTGTMQPDRCYPNSSAMTVTDYPNLWFSALPISDTTGKSCMFLINGTEPCTIRGGDGLPVELLTFDVEVVGTTTPD